MMRSGFSFYLIFLCSALGLQASGESTTVSFQQGDLRRDGVLISSGYDTGCATLSSSAPDTIQTSTSMYVGSSLSGGTPRYYRGLFAFDLSYIETLVGGNPYTIDSIALNLTVATGNSSLPSTVQFRAFATDAFNESTATWNNPGAGHVAGGNIGNPFASRNVTSAMVSTAGSQVVFNATVPGNMSAAITNALAGDKMLYILVKQDVENGLASNYFRPGSDSHAMANYRPELVIGVTYTRPKLSLILIH